jgi:hypothetical protein
VAARQAAGGGAWRRAGAGPGGACGRQPRAWFCCPSPTCQPPTLPSATPVTAVADPPPPFVPATSSRSSPAPRRPSPTPPPARTPRRRASAAAHARRCWWQRSRGSRRWRARRAARGRRSTRCRARRWRWRRRSWRTPPASRPRSSAAAPRCLRRRAASAARPSCPSRWWGRCCAGAGGHIPFGRACSLIHSLPSYTPSYTLFCSLELRTPRLVPSTRRSPSSAPS